MSGTCFFCIPLCLNSFAGLITQMYFFQHLSVSDSATLNVLFVCLFEKTHFHSLIFWSWDFLQASSGFIALHWATTMLYIQLCSQDQNLNCANFLYLDSSHCTEPRLCLFNSLHKIKILIVHTFSICIWIHRIALIHGRACSSFCTRSKSCAYIICMSCGFLRRYEMFKSSS